MSTFVISPLHPRYLDAYEKYYFLGEEEDDDSNLFYDEEDQRQRRQRALRVVQSVPSTYNEGQHRIAGGDWRQMAIVYLWSKNIFCPTERKCHRKGTLGL